MIELNEEQKEGLKVVIQRIKNREPFTCIAGYAGTGKSTMISILTKELGYAYYEVAYCAYTGKAALVLKNKGNRGVSTIHRLIFQSYMQKDGTFVHKLRDHIGNYKLIVVDEISMVPQELFAALMSYGIPIIGLGDPFQLPPITGDSTLLQHPDVFLTQIMRQEEDSEIVQLSMKIRNGVAIDPMVGSSVQIISKDKICSGHFLWADQVICATNRMRRENNSIIRSLKGFSGDLQNGERLICLNNYWDDISRFGDVLVNGSVGEVDRVEYVPRNRYGKKEYKISFFAEGNMGPLDYLPIDYNYLHYGTPSFTPQQLFRIKNKSLVPRVFDFGYCITAHKAQGGEWDKVLVFEERFPFEEEEHARWLYTAVTRASKKLVLVR